MFLWPLWWNYGQVELIILNTNVPFCTFLYTFLLFNLKSFTHFRVSSYVAVAQICNCDINRIGSQCFCSPFQNFHFLIYIFNKCSHDTFLHLKCIFKDTLSSTHWISWNWSFLWLPVENEGTLKHLATVYAKNHPKMHLGDTGCSNNAQSMFKKKQQQTYIELMLL